MFILLGIIAIAAFATLAVLAFSGGSAPHFTGPNASNYRDEYHYMTTLEPSLDKGDCRDFAYWYSPHDPKAQPYTRNGTDYWPLDPTFDNANDGVAIFPDGLPSESSCEQQYVTINPILGGN